MRERLYMIIWSPVPDVSTRTKKNRAGKKREDVSGYGMQEAPEAARTMEGMYVKMESVDPS